jgi:hypothetical protein
MIIQFVDRTMTKYGITATLGIVLLYAQTATCDECGLGQYSAEGTSPCLKCDFGTSTKETGSNSSDLCLPCDAGTYAMGTGIACSACPVGTSSSVIGAQGCSNCLAGSIAPQPGHTSCMKCSAGTYSGTISGTVCTNCPAGQTSDLGATGCSPCPSGYHTLGNGSPICRGCQPNTPYEWSWIVSRCLVMCANMNWVFDEQLGRCHLDEVEYVRIWEIPGMHIFPEDLPGSSMTQMPSTHVTTSAQQTTLATTTPIPTTTTEIFPHPIDTSTTTPALTSIPQAPTSSASFLVFTWPTLVMSLTWILLLLGDM